MNGLDDARGREVDEHAWRAEKKLRAQDFDGAQEDFGRAAAIEQDIAEDARNQSPRIKSVLAVSAVALWYKAGRWTNAERLAHRWLAEDELSNEARDELQDLLQRCWVESQLDPEALPDTLPIELRLIGGEIKRGLAPARLVGDKQKVLVTSLVRIAEWKLEREYRERGMSSLASELEVLQAPARAASYGVRLYVRSKIAEHDHRVSTRALLEGFFELASNVETLTQYVQDPRYCTWFIDNLLKLCADGAQVADVVYSSPTWRVRLPEVHLDYEVGQRLSQQNERGMVTRDDAFRGGVVEGILNVVRLTSAERAIEIRRQDDTQVRLLISDARYDDDLGQWLNRPVRARARPGVRGPELERLEPRGLPPSSSPK
ncbi:MAG: hypothetical protein AAGF11_15925 [Myxococcota bacterium]